MHFLKIDWNIVLLGQESVPVFGTFPDSNQFSNPTMRTNASLVPFISVHSSMVPACAWRTNLQDPLMYYEHFILSLSLKINLSRLSCNCFSFSLLGNWRVWISFCQVTSYYYKSKVLMCASLSSLEMEVHLTNPW